MDNASYFEKLVASITRIARHSYYPGKEEAIELCLQEIEDLNETGRITGDQRAELRELLLGEENSCLLEGMIREREHSEEPERQERIAILCEGAGSLAAFSAGVVQGLLERTADPGAIVALGGTGFGSISALLAWDGLLRDDPRRAMDQLQGFWRDYTAASLIDALMNYSTQFMLHLRAMVPLPGPGADDLSALGHDQLRRMLERQVDFAESRALAHHEAAPQLAVGSVDPQGDLGVVRGPDIEVDAILSAAVSPRPYHVGLQDLPLEPGDTQGRDSPVRCLIESKPSEIWLIQISRAGRWKYPGCPGHLFDVIEKVSHDQLEQELRLLQTINRLLERGSLIDDRYRHIDVHRIIMEHDLDGFSKLDRSPGLVSGLMSYGRDRAHQFLEKREQSLSGRSSKHLVT